MITTHEPNPQTINKTMWEETLSSPEGVRTRIVTATAWGQTRTNCFCCSCNTERSGYVHADPHCRYHGFDGKRPCETHDMPGQMTELTNTPRMPESVEKERLANASRKGES